ncbi:M20 family amidohydrolase (homolog to indole-3-acetyl-aspartate hydrolase) [Natrialba magadii ATCC 43099]|uniref:Amidohydrolase n=1 Tax=Natrialba magadii (strain ATCC 43099 / DSM 3394 / CCM 3739 / CIP 104546 / IAM 13178 / JCM 8861 / NBRC 102185 / NCIMB 2190 / MS3) TaxID=547559 RepID=D3SZR0_NATMM|nr:amidohydrolase [Natrialba magadii]ADD06320.1 M20 family amidohydrolase (homolog to indole-3-acetyl-aspartate hydrolase) [Natrialba magadii ATCC 43099]ELY31245.1 amidohydrolase [Natrialba magadii ATCC 43099]
MVTSDLVTLRRDLHRKPEPAWREFYTTARIVEEVQSRVDLDELHIGPDAIVGEHRLAVPDDAEIAEWYEQASEYDIDEEILSQLEGGYTGAVAVLERGEGPTVGLRVDIDGLPQPESEDGEHAPVAEGFRSEHDGAMHACGHDAHATIGVGVLEAIAESDFSGTFKVFFQPAEEVIGGGKSMATSEHIQDVDALLAAHIGLDHPTGEIVAGIDGFLAVSHLDATFTGAPSHAGGHPEEGRNAVQAMATAVQNLYSIPRHSDGPTRINAGVVEGGTAANVIPEEAHIEAEVRGKTTELMEYMRSNARRVIRNAAEMHDCEVEIELGSEAPSATSDQDLVSIVSEVAGETAGVENVMERDELGGSEDATFLMQTVQDNGGSACYIGVGTDHPGGHHTATFDVDEASLQHGVDVLTGAVEQISRDW